MGLRKVGDWTALGRALQAGPAKLRAAMQGTLRVEAARLRRDIKAGLSAQAPGGDTFAPLAASTLAARRLLGHRGTKALLRTRALHESIQMEVRRLAAFVGVEDGKSPHGEDLVDVAKVMEHGAGPTVVRMTPAMRRFLGALAEASGHATDRGGDGDGGDGTVVVEVPARPFLRPAFEAFARGAKGRFAREMRRRSGVG